MSTSATGSPACAHSIHPDGKTGKLLRSLGANLTGRRESSQAKAPFALCPRFSSPGTPQARGCPHGHPLRVVLGPA